MAINILAGTAQFLITPSSQNPQMLRAYAAADYTAYTINANTSGSTKYDWIYLSGNATNANVPSATADNVVSVVTSRSSSNTTDNGTPPTYGLLLGYVTVVNGASAITNANITDKRFNASLGAQNGSLIVNQNGTGTNAKVQAAGVDANVNLELDTKGTGIVQINGTQIGQQSFKNPYKFNVYLGTNQTIGTGATTRVAFDTTNFDTGTNVDIVTNKGRFTAPVAGFYQFSASGYFGAMNGNAPAGIFLYKNGSVILSGGFVEQGNNASTMGLNVSGLLQLNASDYIETFWFNGDSVGRVLSSGKNYTYFTGFLLSAV
jgi:hypothetical protein